MKEVSICHCIRRDNKNRGFPKLATKKWFCYDYDHFSFSNEEKNKIKQKNEAQEKEKDQKIQFRI